MRLIWPDRRRVLGRFYLDPWQVSGREKGCRGRVARHPLSCLSESSNSCHLNAEPNSTFQEIEINRECQTHLVNKYSAVGVNIWRLLFWWPLSGLKTANGFSTPCALLPIGRGIVPWTLRRGRYRRARCGPDIPYYGPRWWVRRQRAVAIPSRIEWTGCSVC